MVTLAQAEATKRYKKRHPEKNKLYLAQEQKAKRLSDEGAKLRLPVKKQVN